jgi:hypothetical protein
LALRSVSHLQDVFEPFESDVDDFRILHREQLAERWNALLLLQQWQMRGWAYYIRHQEPEI